MISTLFLEAPFDVVNIDKCLHAHFFIYHGTLSTGCQKIRARHDTQKEKKETQEKLPTNIGS